MQETVKLRYKLRADESTTGVVNTGIYLDEWENMPEDRRDIVRFIALNSVMQIRGENV